MTSELIGRFCLAAERATHDAYGHGVLTRYAAELVVPPATRLEVAVLKAVATRYVMRTEARATTQARERELLHALVAQLADRAPDALEPAFAADWCAAADDCGRMRVVVDQVASLTDTSAVALHAALSNRNSH
jgi:dGTPase